MIRRILLQLPPWWSIPCAFVVIYGLILSVGDSISRNHISAEIRSTSMILLTLAPSFLYGIWRVRHTHPYYRRPYREFLETTPWRPGHPLAYGPIELNGVDAGAVAALVAAAAAFRTGAWTWAPLVFAAGYGLFIFWASLDASIMRRELDAPRPVLPLVVIHAWSLSVVVMGAGFQARILSGLMDLMGRLLALPPIQIVTAICLLALARRSLRRSLDLFPWVPLRSPGQPPFSQQLFVDQNNVNRPRPGRYRLMGPSSQITPGLEQSYLPPVRLWIVALAIWWYFVLFRVVFSPAYGIFAYFMVYVFACGLGPLIVYTWGMSCSPPISFWGRIKTRRWIIPGYDRVIVFPIIVIVLSVLLPTLFRAAGLSLPNAFMLSFALMLIIVWRFGISPLRWIMTGPFHLNFGPWTAYKTRFIGYRKV